VRAKCVNLHGAVASTRSAHSEGMTKAGTRLDQRPSREVLRPQVTSRAVDSEGRAEGGVFSRCRTKAGYKLS
jgi:hypothetical protein